MAPVSNNPHQDLTKMKYSIFILTALLLTACSSKSKQAEAEQSNVPTDSIISADSDKSTEQEETPMSGELSKEKDSSLVVAWLTDFYNHHIDDDDSVAVDYFTPKVVERLRAAYDYETDQDPAPMATWDLYAGPGGDRGPDNTYVTSVSWVGDGWWRGGVSQHGRESRH